jgi:uncharacterized membrane protein YhfC
MTLMPRSAGRQSKIQDTLRNICGTHWNSSRKFSDGNSRAHPAVALHISLSVLVWFAAKNGGKCFWLYPFAMLLHSTVNAVAVILSKYVPSVGIILVVIYILSACCVAITLIVWKKYSSKSDITLNTGTGVTV